MISARKLHRQLLAEEAASIFESDGTLRPEVIKASDRIIKSENLKNPKIPSGYSKYRTPSYRSPSGDFQVHFYKNDITGDILYSLDYKSKYDRGIK